MDSGMYAGSTLVQRKVSRKKRFKAFMLKALYRGRPKSNARRYKVKPAVSAGKRSTRPFLLPPLKHFPGRSGGSMQGFAGQTGITPRHSDAAVRQELLQGMEAAPRGGLFSLDKAEY
jgi:hypothetical protein